MNDCLSQTWYDRVPKIELHIHLTGSIPHETLWEIISKYGGDPDVPDMAALVQKFQYRDFPHFLETWNWKNNFLREYEDFTFLSEAVARDLASQNILYAELSFSLPRFRMRGLETARLAEAVRKGLNKVPEIDTPLMVDLVRDFGHEAAYENIDGIAEAQEYGVIGINTGGSEQLFPPEPFAPAYEKARKLGLRTSIHAGEAAGPASIWGALEHLKPDRIGHGTRAIEDPELVDFLAKHAVPIEICLLSNVRTAVVKSAADHPVRRYFERGIPVSINTDDPKMFGNSLADEYRTLEMTLGFTRDEIRQTILYGVEMSWMSPEKKQALTARLTSHEDW